MTALSQRNDARDCASRPYDKGRGGVRHVGGAGRWSRSPSARARRSWSRDRHGTPAATAGRTRRDRGAGRSPARADRATHHGPGRVGGPSGRTRRHEYLDLPTDEPSTNVTRSRLGRPVRQGLLRTGTSFPWRPGSGRNVSSQMRGRQVRFRYWPRPGCSGSRPWRPVPRSRGSGAPAARTGTGGPWRDSGAGRGRGGRGHTLRRCPRGTLDTEQRGPPPVSRKAGSPTRDTGGAARGGAAGEGRSQPALRRSRPRR